MTARRLRLIKALVFCAALLPVAMLSWGFFSQTLGANPFEELTRQSGEWTLRFLLLTLLLRPLRDWTGQAWWLGLRRMLGLFSFFYVTLHMLTYVWFEQFFDGREIVADILQRPFITVGMLAFVLMLPLALTSTRAMMRRLGARWQQLHRLVYVVGILGVLHYFWLVKADLREPLIYALILAGLLGYRLVKWRQRRVTDRHVSAAVS